MDSPNVDRLVLLALTDAHLQIAVRSLERANAILQEPGAMRLGKPMLLVVAKGRTIPAGLRRCADVVLDDWEPTEGAARIAAALKQMGLGDE